MSTRCARAARQSYTLICLRYKSPIRVLAKVKRLDLDHTQITDAGCATLVAALDSVALPALQILDLEGIPASRSATAQASSWGGIHPFFAVKKQLLSEEQLLSEAVYDCLGT